MAQQLEYVSHLASSVSVLEVSPERELSGREMTILGTLKQCNRLHNPGCGGSALDACGEEYMIE
ncbi:hypothetical protein Lal_00017069 [Lupinus albus]|nr:hypothetical protein Lal_00017069 [Lupinus albus]